MMLRLLRSDGTSPQFARTARWLDIVLWGTAIRRAISPAATPTGSAPISSLKTSSRVGCASPDKALLIDIASMCRDVSTYCDRCVTASFRPPHRSANRQPSIRGSRLRADARDTRVPAMSPLLLAAGAAGDQFGRCRIFILGMRLFGADHCIALYLCLVRF